MHAALIATCAAVIYGALAWMLGDRYPFSRYAMYADLGGRSEGAVLLVRVGGQEVDFHDVVAWSGVNPEGIEPFSVPCSLHWVVFEAQRWIRDHTTSDPLPLVVEVGYRILRVTPSGAIEERFESRGVGRARLR